MPNFTIELRYDGGLADDHELDFYDTAVALIGFQRSLALTTHLILNDEIITQAPSLKGARILTAPPEDGSWKIKAIVLMTAAGAFKLGTAPRDTPIGNLVSSAYDYVISETLGFHVDYEQTIGKQYEELRRSGNPVPGLAEPRLQSLAEKCEVAVRDMHRPIVKSETAESAKIIGSSGAKTSQLGHTLDAETFEFMNFTTTRDAPADFRGRVTSYNVNTFKGRIYLVDAQRPVPFELADDARNPRTIRLVTHSLSESARSRSSDDGFLNVTAIALESRSGRIKRLILVNVYN